MNAKQRTELMNAAKRLSTKKLEAIVSTIEEIQDLRERKQKAYFWNPPAVANMRRSYEKRYSRDMDFTVGGYKIDFSSYVKCSCQNIYWTDELTCTDPAGEEISVNCGDLEKIKTYMQERIEAREAKKAEVER